MDSATKKAKEAAAYKATKKAKAAKQKLAGVQQVVATMVSWGWKTATQNQMEHEAAEEAAAASAAHVAAREVDIGELQDAGTIDEDALGELAEELFQLTEANSRLTTAEEALKAEVGELEKKLASSEEKAAAASASHAVEMDELEKKLAEAEEKAAATSAVHEMEAAKLAKKLAGVEGKGAAAASAAHEVEMCDVDIRQDTGWCGGEAGIITCSNQSNNRP